MTTIVAIATLVGGLVYILKFWNFHTKEISDKKNQNIDEQIADEKTKAQQTGRPE